MAPDPIYVFRASHDVINSVIIGHKVIVGWRW